VKHSPDAIDTLLEAVDALDVDLPAAAATQLPVVETADGRAIDMGSGAGLPGLVVAIARPQLEMLLVEPRRTRAAFLDLALERLGVANASVLRARVQEVGEAADLCFARAFAPLPEAWAAALPRLLPSGRLVYFAGAGLDEDALAPLPGSSLFRVLHTPLLESAGPLIIMAR
jgi:16S rRNA G527 N7-methylase RsmG